MLSYLCKNRPMIMRPLIFIILFTGLWSLIVIFFLIVEYIDDFIDGHKDAFNYIFRGYRE